jgi:O-antigen ligase
MKIFKLKTGILNNYQNIILVLLIISGPVKGLFNRFISNFNITLFAFAVAGIDIIYQILKKRSFPIKTFFYLLLLIGIAVLMFFSLSYSSSSIYSKVKFSSFIPVIFCFIYPSFIKNFNWKIYLNVIYYFVIPLSLWFVYYRYFFWSPENSKTRTYEDGFYDILGSYLGLGYLLSLAAFILAERKKWFLLIFIFLLLLALGARGPFFFCILTLFIIHFKKIIYSIVHFKVKVKTLRIFLISAVALGIVIIYKFEFVKEKIYKYGFKRFVSLFSSEKEDISANTRIEVMSFAIENIFTDPFTFFFGNGVGSFGKDFTGIDMKQNPHNIFLEAWYELGFLGFALIALFLFLPFFYKRNSLYVSFIFFALLDCLKSNNLSGIWILAILYSIYLNNLKFSEELK